MNPSTFAQLQANAEANYQATPRQAMSDQMTQQKKKKPWYTALISELGGAGGAAGGAAVGASLGSVVPVLGTALGGLAGAAVGGFLGGTGGRVVENEVRDKRVGLGDALKEGTVNGVLSAGPGNLLRLAKGGTAALAGGTDALKASFAGKSPDELLKTSTRGKLFSTGNQLLANQYGTISKPVARQTNPLETISKLADYGVTKPQDAERISQAFTGGHGIVTQSVADAVGQSKKVDLSNLEKTVDEALANHGVVGNSAKSVKSFVMGQLGRVEDKTAVDPSTALSMLRNIESHSAERLGKGNTYHMATTDDVLSSKALRDTREHITDALYNTAGANKNVASVLTPNFRSQLLALQPKNAKWQQFVDNTVMKSSSVADLRSSMAPFVKIGKIIDEGDTNALTFGGRVGNAIGGGGGSVGGKLLDGAINVVKSPASQFGGSALRAGATAGISPLEAPTLRNIGSRVALANGPQALIARNDPANASAESAAPSAQDPSTLLGAAASGSSDPLLSHLAGTTGDPTAAAGPAQSTGGGPSLESLRQAIQQDIQTNGGKGINQLMQLGQLYGIVDSSGNPVDPNAATKSNVGNPTATQNGLVKGGISGLTQLAQLIQSNPDVINRNATPGQGLPLIGSLVTNTAGDASYHALADNVLGNLIHLQTGATATKEEVAAARGQLPQPGDDAADRQRKLANLYYNFQAFSGGSGGNDLLSQMNGAS
jgi:hypothetical protein